ncbi:MAG: pomA 1 [Acidimicrobiia bacterium]|nr:pomA 1 [Acidimicrobiia bacterium]
MEQGSIIGILMVLVGVFVGTMMKGVSPAFLVSVPAAFLIVLGGAIGAAFIGNPMSTNKRLFKLIAMAFKGPDIAASEETINQVVNFSDRARREGMLSLEDECQRIEDPFLRKGLQMAIDGTDPEQVREVLELEVEAMRERHAAGSNLLIQIGVYSPTFGIIGAVVGLIASLAHMDNPTELAHGISAAFVATFWGVFAANGLFLPFGNKLRRFSAGEAEHKAMVIEGVLAIQAGANPRVVQEMLLSFLSPAERLAIKQERKVA